eukprot:5409391-Amphidinium_carterae.1
MPHSSSFVSSPPRKTAMVCIALTLSLLSLEAMSKYTNERSPQKGLVAAKIAQVDYATFEVVLEEPPNVKCPRSHKDQRPPTSNRVIAPDSGFQQGKHLDNTNMCASYFAIW